MKERPILFSAEMVRAILDGRKTQTRRIVKGIDQRCDGLRLYGENKYAMFWNKDKNDPHNSWLELSNIRCAYGAPGDRLWVRETWKPGAWRDDGRVAVDYKASPELINTPWVFPDGFNNLWQAWTDELIASGAKSDNDGFYHWEPGKSPLKWRPSIFMPRWASRITLEIKNIRVERVQEISELDAMFEGVDPLNQELENDYWEYISPFRDLWDSINAKRGYGWDVNPWVWVIEFQMLK